jgi:hypothetical protein
VTVAVHCEVNPVCTEFGTHAAATEVMVGGAARVMVALLVAVPVRLLVSVTVSETV